MDFVECPKSESINLNDVCRTCFSCGEDMISIFETYENDSLNVYEVMMKFCSIEIVQDDGLPSRMCVACVDNAKKAYYFKIKCEKAEDALKRHLPLLHLKNEFINAVKDELNMNDISDYSVKVDEIGFDLKERGTMCPLDGASIKLNGKYSVIADLGEDNIKLEEPDHFASDLSDKSDGELSFKDNLFDEEIRSFSRKIKLLRKNGDSKKRKSSIRLNAKRSSRHGTKVKKKVESQTVNCEHCEFKTKLPSQLKIHMHIHTGEKPLGCELCSFRCIQLSSLQNHRLTHTNEKPFSCGNCEYKCTNSSNLKRHMRKHTNEKPYFCDMCSYRCAQSSHLKEHRTLHTGEKPYLCDECHYTCRSVSNLKTHKSNKHSIEKRFTCEECSFRAKTKSTLESHRKRHSGEKKFACELCSYKSIQMAALETHKRMVHTGERPFACDQCSYRCVSSSYLKSHQRIHLSVKLLSCDDCGYTCHTKFKLKTHKMTHSGEKPFQCTICDFKCAQSFSLRRHHKRNHIILSK